MVRSFSTFALALAVLAVLAGAYPARADCYQVQGTMEEFNGDGTATGDLAGSYTVKFISFVDNGNNTTTVYTRRTITTAVGKLVLDEVGIANHISGRRDVTSTVVGGTGVFKGATGELHLLGQRNADGTVTFIYVGSICLED
jgi:hypothetical protein